MLRERIQEDTKQAMRAQEKARLGVIRLLLAAIKQQEVDQRITLDDAAIIAVTEKMIKQRRESVRQFTDAGREDLVAQENFEIELLSTYMPKALSQEELSALITATLTEVAASGLKDMGKVMAALKPKIQGRADMSVVSEQIKTHLTA